MFTLLQKRKRDQRRHLAAGNTGAPVTDPKQVDHPDSEPEYKPLEWPVIRKMLLRMKPYTWAYILGAVIGLAMTILEMLGPTYIGHLVDKDIPGTDLHFAARWLIYGLQCIGQSAWAEQLYNVFQLHLSGWGIAFTMACWATTLATAILLQRFNIGFTTRTGQRVIFELRREVFAHLQSMSMSFYDKTKFGRILTRGTSDLDTMSNPIVNGINTMTNNFMQMSVAVFMIAKTDWRIAVAVLWLGPVLYWMNTVYKRRIGAKWRTVREGYTKVSTNLAENISGMRVVTAFNRQSENLSVFNDLQAANTDNNVGAAVLNGIYQPLLNVVGYLGKVIILIFGCYLVLSTGAGGSGRTFTVGMLISAFIYWDWFMGPVLNFGNFHNEIMMAMASAERVFSLLEMEPDVQDRPGCKALPRVEGTVTFDHLAFSYRSGVQVLHDITFQANPGQTIALVGHTGCGKSTIMNLICRFYEPQAGSVRIDGHDLRDVTGESLHNQMGIVSQSNYLFSGTVLENITYASPKATLEDVQAAAKILGCHEILLSLKDGYHSQVGERGSTMSLGQRQLICFTRAFLANPRILMLDEATSAVDTHTEMVIQDALERLVAHRTTFIVAHRLSTVIHADMVLVLDHGHIIERGTHQTLLALNGKYAELYKQFTREV